MVRIARLPWIVTAVAALAGAGAITAAADLIAAPRAEAAPHHARMHAHHRAPVRVAVRTVVVGYTGGVAPRYYASAAPNRTLPQARGVAPVYYVGPLAVDAPPFSFNGSAAEPGWNWQRVNLQQLAAEVRARREAADKP